MSSINEALRRSRQPNEALGTSPPPGWVKDGHPSSRPKVFFVSITAAVVLLGTGALFYLATLNPPEPTAQETRVSAAPPARIPPSPAAEMKPAAEPETPGIEKDSDEFADDYAVPRRRFARAQTGEGQEPARPGAGQSPAPVTLTPRARVAAPGAGDASSLDERDPGAPRYRAERTRRIAEELRAGTAPAARTEFSGNRAEPVPAAEVKPEQAIFHFNQGQAAQQNSRYDEAVASYRQALRIDPRMTRAYLNLGNIYYYQQGEAERALEMYRQVLKIDPGNKFGHNNIGVILLKQNLLDQAESEFAAALKTDRRFVDALYNMACVSARQGLSSQALENLNQAARVNPDARRWAANDADLKPLWELPEFQRFINPSANNE